ncbi:hypothetical protein CISIN_1g048554mg, partial [Citrus sinensis]
FIEVDNNDIDMAVQKVTLMSWEDQKKVLKIVKKTGRSVKLWPYSYNPNGDFGYYPQSPYSHIFDELTDAMFSDENPHACSLK